MKKLSVFFLIQFSLVSLVRWNVCAQPAKHVIVVTLDGFRWQEIFSGADSNLLINPSFVNDTSLCKALYEGTDENERRRKLMPFLWSYIQQHGQIWGNRRYLNHVEVENQSNISFAGYRELFSGQIDRSIQTNRTRKYKPWMISDFLAMQDSARGNVALFGSWNKLASVFQPDSGNGIVCSLSNSETGAVAWTDAQTSVYDPVGEMRSDAVTFQLALQALKKYKPRFCYIGFGESDMDAHQHAYDRYLLHATQVDQMLAMLWVFVQSDTSFNGRTLLVFTTDHGRGSRPRNWFKHGQLVPASGETWMALLGQGIHPLGERKDPGLITAVQLASTIAYWLGFPIMNNPEVAESFIPMLEFAQRSP